MAWFHCGHCGSLFRSEGGEADDRRCASCGNDPSLGLESVAAPASAGSGGRDPMLRVRMAEVEKPAYFKREVLRQKGTSPVVKIIIAWVVLMVLLAVGARLLWSGEHEVGSTTGSGAGQYERLADRDEAFLDDVYGKCLQAMSGFISSGTPEEKNQFVRNPVDTAGTMARYYQTHLVHHIDPSTVRGTGRGVIHLDDGRKLVETRWSVADGRMIDGTFFEERGEWKLDWEEYVRFGDRPWALFLTGSGDETGEFRLFARERRSGERSALGDLRIIFHEPKFGYPKEAGDASPEFVVDPLSDGGRMLGEAFAKRAKGGRVYGSTLPVLDPEEMIRVRVKVRRRETPDGREFKIEEVKACHWLSIDDPGVER